MSLIRRKAVVRYANGATATAKINSKIKSRS